MAWEGASTKDGWDGQVQEVWQEPGFTLEPLGEGMGWLGGAAGNRDAVKHPEGHSPCLFWTCSAP